MAGGRPTKMDDLTVKKLEEAFALGCTDVEACLYAGISRQTLQNYQTKYPEFIDRKEQLKETPVLKARTTVVSELETDSKLAMEYLKHKKSDEFNTKQSIDQNNRYVDEMGKDLHAKDKEILEEMGIKT